jgi:hypothetical protein
MIDDPVVAGIDAARRAAWAKYYAATENNRQLTETYNKLAADHALAVGDVRVLVALILEDRHADAKLYATAVDKLHVLDISDSELVTTNLNWARARTPDPPVEPETDTTPPWLADRIARLTGRADDQPIVDVDVGDAL